MHVIPSNGSRSPVEYTEQEKNVTKTLKRLEILLLGIGLPFVLRHTLIEITGVFCMVAS